MTTKLLDSWRVFGEPKPQPRPRAFTRNGHASVYDPGTAEGWKGSIALAIGGGRKPYDQALSVAIDFYFAPPKNLQKKCERGETHFRTSKPDIDNLIKSTLDAMTALWVWFDDSQIVEIRATKRYATPDCSPGAVIHLSEVQS